MRIEKLIIPTPFPVGPINIYLIVDDPLTLVDTGPKTDEASAALQQQLAALGFRFEHLERIILTHTHEDHCGLAATLQEASGAIVHVHEWEAEQIGPNRHSRVIPRLLDRCGVPPQTQELLSGYYAKVRSYADAVERIETYSDEQEFVFASGAMRVIHTPGHTPGSCCLLRESSRLMLTGDTVLKNITPNPVLNADPVDPARRFASLGEYLVSLARIRSLAPTLLRTSHGDDVTDFEEYFYRLVRHIRERQTKVLSLIPRQGITAWEMSLLLFPDVKEISRLLAVSEAVAHLDLCVADARLRLESRDHVEHYLHI